MAGIAIVGKRHNRNPATRHEDTANFDIARMHQRHKVFHNDIDAVFMEIAMVAKAEEI